MASNLRKRIASSVIAIALTSAVAAGQPGFLEAIAVPPVPPNIQVPSGHTPFLKAHAVGTQNYICKPSDSGFAWTLFGPQATLFVSFKVFNMEIRQQVMTHYLSPNPSEG